MPRFLRNPLVLGSLAIVAAVVAAIVVAILFSDSNEGDTGAVTIQPSPGGSTPGITRTPTSVPLEGMAGHALSTLTVRAGPGSGYVSLGTARRDSALEVVGKNEDGDWLAIYYPPRSRLTGWVEAAGVELDGSVASLPVATPESLVLPAVPTYAGGGPYVEEEPDVLPTEAPLLPDLVVSRAYLQDGVLVVTITNQGAVDVSGVIDVGIYTGDGSVQLRLARAGESLPAGSSIDLDTRYEPGGDEQRLLIWVDAANRVEEGNEDNNEVLFGVSGPPPSPSPTAPRRTPTPTVTPRFPLPVPTATVRPASTPTRTPRPASTPTPSDQSTPPGGG